MSSGVELGDVYAAYTPYGAANLAASLVNNAHPGVNDAATTGVNPGHSALGWGFVAGSGAYLSTGMTIDVIDANVPAYSAIIRYTGLTPVEYAYLFGGYSGDHAGFGICPSTGFGAVYRNGGIAIYEPDAPTTCVLAFGEQFAYRNGVLEVIEPITESDGTPIPSLYIGALNMGDGPDLYITATISHFAVYKMTLDEAQLDEVYQNILDSL
jgi:hypothetical protein